MQLAEKLPVIDLGAPEDLPQHNVRTKGTKQIDEKKTEHVISSSNVTEKLSVRFFLYCTGYPPTWKSLKILEMYLFSM